MSRYLLTFPTRRSSDLIAGRVTRLRDGRLRFDYDEEYRVRPGATPLSLSMRPEIQTHLDGAINPWLWNLRSEEHTSELQSLTNLVCRLLLEKKKNTNSYHKKKNTSDLTTNLDEYIHTTNHDYYSPATMLEHSENA